MRKFAISDIHGCSKTFRSLVEDTLQLSKEDQLFLLGDYIDRGPDSRGVLDYIVELQQAGYQVTSLIGNHEWMLLESQQDGGMIQTWMANGGIQTLESFGADSPRDIPQPYQDFMAQMPYYLEIDEYILVHAGLDFRSSTPLADPMSLIWIRNWHRQVNKEWLNGRVVVHGHTPVTIYQIDMALENLAEVPVIDIDAGCYMAGKLMMGHLCAFELGTRELHFQRNLDM